VTARGRPRKLTAGLIDALAFNVELTGSVEAGARAAGVAPRSLRRWQEQLPPLEDLLAEFED
jgi:hypothetical protein